VAEHQHGWLTAAAATLVLTGFFGWRTVNGYGDRGAGSTAPNPGLARLTPFASLVSDSLTVRLSSVGSVALRRDPFGTTRAPRFTVTQVGSAAKPAPVPPRTWNVSATLMVGSRRAAIIDDVLINVGDMLPGGVTLTSVERDSVVLTDSRGKAHTIVVREVEEDTRDR
jgi:hypothetical protein